MQIPGTIHSDPTKWANLPGPPRIKEQTGPEPLPEQGDSAQENTCLLAIDPQAGQAHDTPANQLSFPASADARQALIRHGIPLTQETAQKLLALDGKRGSKNGLIDLAELDIDGDGQVSRKEIQYILSWKPAQLSFEGGNRLQTQPAMLPNRQVEGAIQINVNNGEKVSRTGLLFDSQKLNPVSGRTPLRPGIDNGGRFETYLYNNFGELRDKLLEQAKKEQLKGQALSQLDPFYVQRLENPPGNPPIQVVITGSGLLNSPDPAFEQRMISQLPASLSADERKQAIAMIHEQNTRLNDADLQDRVLNPDRHQLKERIVTIQPGQSVMVYTRMPLASGTQDFRGQFEYQVTSLDPKHPVSVPLHIQTGVVTKLPGAGNGTGILGEKGGLSPDAIKGPLAQLQSFVEPIEGKTEHLKQASDLSSPKALAEDMRQHQLADLLQTQANFEGLLDYLDGKSTEIPDTYKGQEALLGRLKSEMRASGQTAEKLLEPYLTRQELQEYVSKGQELVQALDGATAFDESLMVRIRGWNADMKMIQRVVDLPLDQKGKTNKTALEGLREKLAGQFWSPLVTLGRVNGIVEGQRITSKLEDLVLESGQSYNEWNYTLNTHPLNTGGVKPGSQSDASPIAQQSANVESPPPLSYGNYGSQYHIEGTFLNGHKESQYLDIRIGSPDEMGHVDWQSLFDTTDTFAGETSTRFTGTVKLRLKRDGQDPVSYDVSIVQGRVQAPQSLLKELQEVKGGESIGIELDLVAATNSTPPLLLQFRAGKLKP
ncbi:MAG TPA: DUF3370 family protein [Candidatus Obscuribacterales bacterium]